MFVDGLVRDRPGPAILVLDGARVGVTGPMAYCLPLLLTLHLEMVIPKMPHMP